MPAAPHPPTRGAGPSACPAAMRAPPAASGCSRRSCQCFLLPLRRHAPVSTSVPPARRRCRFDQPLFDWGMATALLSVFKCFPAFSNIFCLFRVQLPRSFRELPRACMFILFQKTTSAKIFRTASATFRASVFLQGSIVLNRLSHCCVISFPFKVVF